MSKIEYNKISLTYQEQIDQLKRRGLIVENEEKALHLLQNISYYRLSGYWYSLLLDKEQHIFKEGATFDTAFKLYCFDRKLRSLVSSSIEKIEVAVRSKMISVLSDVHGPFWFEDYSIFVKNDLHDIALKKMKQEYFRSDEIFVGKFKQKYSNPLPPCWIILEITSFGTLSKLYKNLNPGKEKREIAHYFGVSDSVFVTWLHSLVYLRNICAHHTRLWDRSLSISPQKPHSPREPWLANKHVNNQTTYFILSMINYLLQSINPTNNFRGEFKILLNRYSDIDLLAMGFPRNWETENLWADKTV